MTAESDPKADERMRVILEHLAGRASATEAATELGVSRKTYYEWLERARGAMREALTDRPGGRPPNPADPEKEQLQETVKALERDRAMLESRLRIQQVFRETLDSLTREAGSKKKG